MILQGYYRKFILKDKLIGQGGFGQVFEGQVWQNGEKEGELVAIKKVSKIMQDGQEYKNYKNELEITLKILTIEKKDPCEYIMNILDFCQEDESFYIITQYYQHGDFLNFLNQNFEYFTLDIVLDILIQIIKAINYLHRHNITHRDLKPENILISKQQQMYFVKVADFGSATIQDFSYFTGTPNYMAPETFLNKSLSDSIDIWSFGCLAYEIITKKQFFSNGNSQQIARQILQYSESQYKNQNQNDQYFQIHQIIKQYCLQPDPSKRKSAQFLVDELFQLRMAHLSELKKYDFELINSQEVVFQYDQERENFQGSLGKEPKQSTFSLSQSGQNNVNMSKQNFNKHKSIDEIEQFYNSQVSIIQSNNFRNQSELKAEAEVCEDRSDSQLENLSFSLDLDTQKLENQAEDEAYLKKENEKDLISKNIIPIEQQFENEVQQLSQNDLKNKNQDELSESTNNNPEELNQISQKNLESQESAEDEKNLQKQNKRVGSDQKLRIQGRVDHDNNKLECMMNQDILNKQEMLVKSDQIYQNLYREIIKQIEERNIQQPNEQISYQQNEIITENKNTQSIEKEIQEKTTQSRKENNSILKQIERRYLSNHNKNQNEFNKTQIQIQNIPILSQYYLQNSYYKKKRENSNQLNKIDIQNSDSSNYSLVSLILLPYLVVGISVIYQQEK